MVGPAGHPPYGKSEPWPESGMPERENVEPYRLLKVKVVRKVELDAWKGRGGASSTAPSRCILSYRKKRSVAIRTTAELTTLLGPTKYFRA